MTKQLIFCLLLCGSFQLAAAQDYDAELGESSYSNCVGCHQAEGEGIPGVFPALAGHLPNVVAKEGGRTYLINVLLYGLSGEITVLGDTVNGAMPAWGNLSDEGIAAVLNHELHSWGNDAMLPEGFTPVEAAEVAELREQGLSAEDVHELRTAIGLSAEE